MLHDNEAFDVSTTNARRLLRYHMEDMLRAREGDGVVLFVRNDMDLKQIPPTNFYRPLPRLKTKLLLQLRMQKKERKS